MHPPNNICQKGEPFLIPSAAARADTKIGGVRSGNGIAPRRAVQGVHRAPTDSSSRGTEVSAVIAHDVECVDD